jgi:hypothetical protein
VLQLLISGLNKTVASSTIGTHCMTHRQVLAAKTLSSGFKQIMFLVIQAADFIKSKITTKLCFEMNAPLTQLLIHAELRWLSKGEVSKCVYDMHE